MSYQVLEKVTLLPAVPGGQHGDDAVNSVRPVFDSLGRLLWQKSPRGFITFTLYDRASNLLMQRIEDVNVATYNSTLGGGGGTSGEYPPVPQGWQTPVNGGNHAETLFEYDRQGRVIMEIGPKRPAQLAEAATSTTEVRSVTYHTYDDVARQRRTARGYRTTAATPVYSTVGWVSVQNYDAGGRVIEGFEAVRASDSGSSTAAGMGPVRRSSSSGRRWRCRRALRVTITKFTTAVRVPAAPTG